MVEPEVGAPEVPDGWTLLATHSNPWGVVPMTDGGRCTPEYVTRYMDRVAAEAARRNCRSRQHHCVPRAYLRRWTEQDDMLRRIDTRVGELERRHPTATCRIRHFYQVTGPEGRRHNQVENWHLAACEAVLVNRRSDIRRSVA